MSLPTTLADPRCYQIAVLAGLLTFGIVALEFGIRVVLSGQWGSADAGHLTGTDKFNDAFLSAMCAA